MTINCEIPTIALQSKMVWLQKKYFLVWASHTDTDPTISLLLTTKSIITKTFFTHWVRVAWDQMIFQNTFLAVAVAACAGVGVAVAPDVSHNIDVRHGSNFIAGTCEC
jgi:hypothetical protein